MIFFDLAELVIGPATSGRTRWPAEASDESSNGYQASRRRETGNHPRIKSEGKLFGIML